MHEEYGEERTISFKQLLENMEDGHVVVDIEAEYERQMKELRKYGLNRPLIDKNGHVNPLGLYTIKHKE